MATLVVPPAKVGHLLKVTIELTRDEFVQLDKYLQRGAALVKTGFDEPTPADAIAVLVWAAAIEMEGGHDKPEPGAEQWIDDGGGQ